MRLLLCASVLTLGGSLFASTDCGVSESDWAWLRNHIAWTKAWYEESIIDAAETRLEYAKHQDTVFWFFPSAKLRIGYSPNESTSYSAGGTCELEPWTKCIKVRIPSREKHDLTDLLLGRFPKEKEKEEQAVISEICHRPLEQFEIGEWRPSPDSPEKRAILSRIDAEVREHASFGLLKTAVVNDFNVLDPEVFAVVEVEHPRSHKRLIMFMWMKSGVDGFARLWRVEEESDDDSVFDNRPLVERILRNTIKIQ